MVTTLLLTAVVLAGCTNGNSDDEVSDVNKKQVHVQTITLQDEVVSSLSVSGTIVPRQYSLVRSLVQGTVEFITPVGTDVKIGTPLFHISDDNVERAYENALQNLQSTEVVTRDRISQAELTLSSAQARENLAHKNLDSAMKQVEQTGINAEEIALISYGSAYNTLSQLLNFVSDGELTNYTYKYKIIVTPQSELREQGDLQFYVAAQEFVLLPSSALVTGATLNIALDQLSSALTKAKLLTDTTSVLLQNALGGVPNLATDQTTVATYQTQINTQSAALLAAKNTLRNAAISGDLAIEQAQNNLELAQIELNNATIALENAKTSAHLERTLSQSRLDSAAYQFGNLSITSPFSGTVISTSIEAGQQVSVGQEIIELGNLTIVEIQVDVDTDFAKGLKVGDAVTINGARAGTITEIEPVGSLTSGKVGVTVQADNAEELLVAGDIAEVTFGLTYQQSGLIIIPINAATIESTDTYVLVIENGMAARRSVALGQIFGNRVSVTTGLAESDQLILRNGIFISDGDAVEVVME